LRNRNITLGRSIPIAALRRSVKRFNESYDFRGTESFLGRRDFCAAYYGEEAGRVIEEYLDDTTAEFVKQDVPGPATLAARAFLLFCRLK